MRAILVTGAAGFVGSEVVRALADEGEEVVAVVRPGRAALRLAGVPRVRRVETALEDRASVRALLAREQPRCVMHLAWYADPRDYLTSPRNLDALGVTLALVEEALGAGVRKLVVTGTCLEYAPAPVLHREDDRCDPESLYASAKRAAFLVTRALAAAAGAEFAWARLFHLHGPGESQERLIPAVAAALRAGRPFDLSAGEQVRDHLHVADAARAIVLLCRPGVVGPVNVCSGQPVPLREVLATVGALLGRAELLRFGVLPFRPGEDTFLAGDPARLRALGFSPRFGLLDGLADALGLAPAPGEGS